MNSDSKAGSPRPFDTQVVEYLIHLMSKNDLSELDLQEGEQRIRLRRGTIQPVATVPVMPAAAPVAVSVSPGPASAAPASTTAAPAASGKKLHEIKSPMVGTFYARPKPDQEPYVKVGSTVRPDTVVCKLEAMKIFNDLPAECSGTVMEVCVQDKQPVDFDTVLFRVELS